MKILSIDTSSSICAVALLENDTIICENCIDNGKTHSENFMCLVDKTLKENNLKLNEINLFACCVGPGSFTGVRIGIASIKAMAEIMNIPIVEVTSLESLAYNVKCEGNTLIVSMIDARNSQVYAGVFDDNVILQEKYIADDIETSLDMIKKIIESRKAKKLIFDGNATKLHEEKIRKRMKKLELTFAHEIDENLNKQSGVSVGKCGYNKFIKKDNIESADTLKPLYLRKSQAERMKNDKK